MSAWLDLLIKEIALLALLAALGGGFARHMPGAGGLASRIALAPAFGLALGSAALTTAAFVMPMRVAAWTVLLPLAVASTAVALRGLRRERAGAFPSSDLLQLGAIVLIVIAALNYPLAKRDSIGPMGLRIADAAGYVALTDGLERHKLEDDSFGPAWDLGAGYAGGYTGGFQHLGFDTLAAGANATFGWSASETQSAFMAVLIIVGALGLFGVVRTLTGSRSWAAMLAALLFAGPLAYQLYLDSSEGALAGLALFAPIGLAGALVMREPSVLGVVALAVLIAGLETVYPLFVPPLVISVLVVLAVLAIGAIARRRLSRDAVARTAALLAATAVIAIALSPVAFERSVRYWDKVASGGYLEATAATLPTYDLRAAIVPSYVLQTREFYFLSQPSDHSLQQLALGYLAPLFLVLVILYGVWRYRSAWVLLPGIFASALLAYYASADRDCSYCTQRNLVVIAPLAAALVGVGFAALAGRERAWLKWGALAAAVGVLVLAGHKSSVLARRAVDGGYALPTGARDLLDQLDERRGPLYLEGAGSGFAAAWEMPFLYHATNEATAQRLAVNVEYDDYRGLLYIGGQRSRGPEFVPDYRWVLTRLAGIRTQRSTIARRGPFALQERNHPIDISVVSGVVADTYDRDHGGLAWVQAPLRFWVSAPPKARVSARLAFTGPAAESARVPARARILTRRDDVLVLCMPVEGKGALRTLAVPLKFTLPPTQPPPETFGAPWIPGKALRLAEMSATAGRCPGKDRLPSGS